jgi:hypothetical protein
VPYFKKCMTPARDPKQSFLGKPIRKAAEENPMTRDHGGATIGRGMQQAESLQGGASGREASGRYLGSTWETSGGHPGTSWQPQEAPRDPSRFGPQSRNIRTFWEFSWGEVPHARISPRGKPNKGRFPPGRNGTGVDSPRGNRRHTRISSFSRGEFQPSCISPREK